MTYEEMVKLNIDTKMTKAELIEMMCEDLSDQIEASIAELQEGLDKLKLERRTSREKYLRSILKDLRISVDKDAEIEIVSTRTFSQTQEQVAEIERLKREFENAPVIERSRSYGVSFPYHYEKYMKEFEAPKIVKLRLTEKKVLDNALVNLTSISKIVELTLTPDATEYLADTFRENVFNCKVIECKIAIERKKLESVSRSASKFRAQITRKILESTPDGQKVIKMLNGVSRKLNARAITEK